VSNLKYPWIQADQCSLSSLTNDLVSQPS
ncbi:uncharacterized protein METZ01_LOCUS59234, partial [marine metagenome]